MENLAKDPLKLLFFAHIGNTISSVLVTVALAIAVMALSVLLLLSML